MEYTTFEGGGDGKTAIPLVAGLRPEPPGVVEFARTRLGMDPDEWQEAILRSETKRGILNCPRQWGKSTMAAAKAVHRMFTRPGSLVLVAGPTIRQTGEFVRKCAVMAIKLGIKPRGDGPNKISLLLPNGSRIIGLPRVESNVRCFSAVSLLVIDEASRVDDAMYKALHPMLAMGDGDVWLMSTPCGKQGFFYEVWEYGGPDWEKVSVRATDCPRFTEKFLAEQRVVMGPAWFEQEFMCGFVDSGAAVFGRDLVERSVDRSIEPLFPGSTWD